MKKKTILIAIVLIFALPLLILGSAFTILFLRTRAILNDYSSIFEDEKYQTAITLENVEVITQDITCGYAVIEMFAHWDGKNITEEQLESENEKVVTAYYQGFEDEMNKRFPEYKTTLKSYLSNTEMIDEIYTNLVDGIPVPIGWAALLDEDWTLHYSLVYGIDILNDKIEVANPYGYNESLTIEQFLLRTSYEAYDPMPTIFKFAFAFNVFEKNTLFRVQRNIL